MQVGNTYQGGVSPVAIPTQVRVPETNNTIARINYIGTTETGCIIIIREIHTMESKTSDNWNNVHRTHVM